MSEGATDSGNSSPDVYVRQLREIFVSSDSSGSGLLNRSDLQRLCRRLNLEGDVSKRITDSLCLTSDDRRCVGFDEFKETFINILTETEQTSGDDGDETSGHERSLDHQAENALDLSEEEKHLLSIWKELGVGANGSLGLTELSQVCHFLNMGHMTNKDVEQLFAKLDVDGDGFVSFGELLHGLFEIGELTDPEQLPPNPHIHAGHTLSLPLEKSSHQRSLAAPLSHSLHAHETIMAFLGKKGSRSVNSQVIVELWESLGVKEGHLILKLLRFDVKRSISLLELSLALVDEIHSIEVDNNIVYQAALRTVEHTLDYLHSVNEDLKLERDGLVADLSTMKKRNAAIVAEFDERSGEEEKTHQQRLAAVETKYQKVLIQLKQKSDDSDQLQHNLNAAKQEVASLVEKLRLTNKVAVSSSSSAVSDGSNALTKMSPSSSPVDKEKTNRLELENKELRDRLEAQSIYLNDLMHELSSDQGTLPSAEKERQRDSPLNNADDKADGTLIRDDYETELQALMRGMSMERKDIEGAFRLEITELEQRHLDQLTALRKEFETEKDEIISGHKRHLAEAVSERERDLLTEFAKEAGQKYSDSAEVKELRENLRQAQETAKERSLYADELETKLSALQEEKDEKMKSSHGLQAPDEEDDDEEMIDSSSRDELRLMERVSEEKKKMWTKFQEDLNTIRQEHNQELVKLNSDLTKGFRLEKDKAETSFVSERRKLEEKINSMENDLQRKEEEKERHRKEVEKEIHRKDLETELRRKELEEQLYLKDVEIKLCRTELEKSLRKKEEEQKLFERKLEEEWIGLGLEKEQNRADLERDRRKKEEERQLLRIELEEERMRIGLEKEQYRADLERDQRKKEEEHELRKKELERDVERKEEENESLRDEIERVRRLNERIEIEKEEPTRETDQYIMKLEVDELCRKNVQLKDELEKRDEELVRLREEMERNRQLKRDHLTPVIRDHHHQLITKTSAMVDRSRDRVLMERDLLKEQLQLTVKQLAEATSALSLVSDELRREKEANMRISGQVVARKKYDDVVRRLRDTEAKSHHLQHDCDFRAAETTKLLSLSQTVSKQRLSHLMEENEKLEKQVKQRKVLINDQLTKITKQADELLKSDALIRDLYIENAHLIRCLQMTEGNRQDSDMKVQVLHQKCIDLGRLLSTVGPLAINHH